MSKDTQSRKYQLTINNPLWNGDFSHENITIILRNNFPSLVYYCMADERGLDEDTPHTHIYIAFSGGVRFSTIKKHFPTAHIENAHGTSVENRDYIAKAGKWENDEKHGTKIDGTFEEWGDLPRERQGARSDLEDIFMMLQCGASNAEIAAAYPDHYMRMDTNIERIRQKLKATENRDKWRDLETIYICGETGVGKTRYVMDKYGYSDVYAVNDYKHPFDGYNGEFVILFDEYNSGISIQKMNNYLDGYPLSLPARYSNKVACYERVFIISNLDLREQYRHEQDSQSDVWNAFVRRIHKVLHFLPDGTKREYDTQDYLNNVGTWKDLADDECTPFDETDEVIQASFFNDEKGVE